MTGVRRAKREREKENLEQSPPMFQSLLSVKKLKGIKKTSADS